MNAEQRAARLARLQPSLSAPATQEQNAPVNLKPSINKSELPQKNAAKASTPSAVLKRRAPSVKEASKTIIDLTGSDDDVQVSAVNPTSCSDELRATHKRRKRAADALSGSIAMSLLKFATGATLMTTSASRPRPGHISLEDVLQLQTLDYAALSSYQVNMEWLFGKIDLGRTKLLFCLHAADETEHAQHKENMNSIPGRGVSVIFPKVTGRYACMHSKLMLLFHDSHLRVAVPTANLLAFDWGEDYGTGTMDNMLFLIDLPRKSRGFSGVVRQPASLVANATPILPDTVNFNADFPFLHNLVRYLLRAGYPLTLVDRLLSYDFSATHPYDFVSTSNGYHVGDAVEDSGRYALARAVRGMTGPPIRSPQWTCLTSSVGNLNWSFLNGMATAMLGQTVLGKGPVSTAQIRQLRADFRILFPTKTSVHNAVAGEGVLFLAPEYISEKTGKPDSAQFPKECLCEYLPKKLGILSHTKVLLCEDKIDGHGVAYIGSANLSASAWGDTLTKDAGARKLFTSNWETGVIVPAYLIRERLPIKMDGNFPINRDPWTTPKRT